MSNANVSIPLEILRMLGPAAEKLGLSLPDESRVAPVINVTQNIRSLAWDLGRLLAKENLFILNDEVVTVDATTGEVKRMTSRRLPGWAEAFCNFIAPGSRAKRESLEPSDAATILETDVFLGELRKVTAVHDVRLPVMRASGEPELLAPGFDTESGIFTVDTLPYDLDWTLEQACEWLEKHGEGYPWSQPDEQPQSLKENRNWSVHLAGMVGTYCKAMFPPGTTKPMILYVGNQPGTGKSTLVSMDLIPVFGAGNSTKTPKDDADMDKELETAAQCRAPYMFFDDIGHGIFSNPLNRFITSPGHTGRVMGGNSAQFRVPNVTQVFATGNALKISDDLARRSLISFLFLPGEVRGRKFPIRINPKYLARPEIRAKFLSALWALVRNYAQIPKESRFVTDPLESFEEWTDIVACVVMAAGYENPLAPAVFDVGGTEETDEVRELLIKLATSADHDTIFDRKAVVECARKNELIEAIVGSEGEKEQLDGSANKRLGRQLEKWRGRELVDERGRRFRFGHRRKKRGASYPLAFIK